MKIDEAISARSTRSEVARPGASHRGFAELIEAGGRAANIVANRALGFAETGILGVHNAVSDCQTVHSPPSTSGPIAGRPLQLPGGVGHVQPQTTPLGLQITDHQPLDPVEATTMPRDGKNFGSATPTVTGSVSGQSPEISTNDFASGEAVEVHSNRPPAMRTDSRSVALASGRFVRFQLVDDKDGAVMVLANLPFTEQELHELAGVSQAVGREFGVTVHRIVIRGINKELGSNT